MSEVENYSPADGSTNLYPNPTDKLFDFLNDNFKNCGAIELLKETPFFSELGESRPSTIEYYYGWYSKRKGRYKHLFYLLGAAVLLIMLALALNSQKEGFVNIFWLPFSSLLIATASFIGLKSTWSGYYRAMKRIETLYDLLFIDLMSVKLLANPNQEDTDKEVTNAEQEQEIVKLLHRFVSDFHKVVEDESLTFFEGIKFPKGK